MYKYKGLIFRVNLKIKKYTKNKKDQEPQRKDRGSSEESRAQGPADTRSHPLPEGRVQGNHSGMSPYPTRFATLENIGMAPSNLVDNGANWLLSSTR